MKKEKFESGAEREANIDKGRFDLLPPKGITRVARRFQMGAQKYSDRNWEKGMPHWKFIDSALRHIFQYQNGQVNEDHLAAAVSNLLMLMELENENKESS